MAWFWMAIAGAVLWGIHYNLVAKVFEKMSVVHFYFYYFIFALATLSVFLFFAGDLPKIKSDFENLVADKSFLQYFFWATATWLVGGILICLSIQSKNPTLTSVIEISYPIFVVLFAWILFRENQLTWATAIGGLLIFSGVATIYIFNSN